MSDVPLVSALCSTYGRPEILGEALWCFLQQTYPNKEMIIVNDKPDAEYIIDPACMEEGVKLVNCKERFASLGAKRNYVKSLVSPESKYCCLWEDDDLSMPWRMEESVKALEHNPQCDGVKTGMSLFSTNNEAYHISWNNFEGSTCHKTDFLRKFQYNEALSVKLDLEMERNGQFWSIVDTYPLFWYCYRWGMGTHHLSGLTDEKETWEHSLSMACFQRVKGQIEVVPHFVNNYWLDIYNYLQASDPKAAKTWEIKMTRCGVTL